MTWHNFLGSQETGNVKSRVWVMQMGDVQGIGVYEVECKGSYDKGVVGVFLQWRYGSSLPVSSTMMTGCGGEPTVSVMVKETLWLKDSFLEGFVRDPDGSD